MKAGVKKHADAMIFHIADLCRRRHKAAMTAELNLKFSSRFLRCKASAEWRINMTDNNKIHLRTATPQDAKDILSIYAPYVRNTAITFEYDVPTLEEFTGRIMHTLEKYPYIVAEHEDKIVGYAYAGAFNERAAYDWAVETTIYVDQTMRKMGIGKILYSELEKALAAQGITNLYACIGYPDKEDEYLTKNSVQFHEHLGYRFVGEFYKCGYKFNRWYNMVWMEKNIGRHVKEQPPVIKFADIENKIN